MKAETVDMSPEAITNRLKTMEQLWELSVGLIEAEEISESPPANEQSVGETDESAAGAVITTF